MSDSTPNNPGNRPLENFGPHDNNSEYELITAYIDNEIKDPTEYNRIKNLIETIPDYHNRYIFEKLTKETLQSKIKPIQTPAYLYTNIGNGITEYIESAKRKSAVNSVDHDAISDIYSQQLGRERSNLRRYLTYGGFALVLLVVLAFIFNSYLRDNPQLTENDLVSVSRRVFDKIESGEVKLQFKSRNAKELADSMNKYLDFNVFIPDVKDADLEGGVCNEQNGEKLAHIIHRKNGIIIYTSQASMKHIMNNEEKVNLCPEFKENVTSGKNWFQCDKDKSKTAVVWFKDGVICSSVAHLDYQDISKTLTSYK